MFSSNWSIKRPLLAVTLFLCSQAGYVLSQATPSTSSPDQISTPAQYASTFARTNQKSSTSENISREWLESRGVAYSLTYRAETFANLHGGQDRSFGGEYLGSVDTTFAFDLKKLHLGRGHVVVSSQNLHGRSINDRKVGAIQAISNLDNGSFTKLTEAYYCDSYLGDRLTVKFGREYADADFGVIDTGGDFINSSYGLMPTVPLPTYPTPQFGGSVWATPLQWMSVGVGVFQGDTLAPIKEGGPEITKGVFTVAETKISPFSKTATFRGSYHVGIWRQGEGAYKTSYGAASAPLTNYGVYATGDHWFRKSTSAGENVGPGVFFQFGWSPKDRNEVTRYWGGGVAWLGIFPKRPHDSIGVGVTRALLVAADRGETVTELFYKLKATKKMSIQPDLQWVSKPAGIGSNALLGGVRISYEF